MRVKAFALLENCFDCIFLALVDGIHRCRWMDMELLSVLGLVLIASSFVNRIILFECLFLGHSCDVNVSMYAFFSLGHCGCGSLFHGRYQIIWCSLDVLLRDYAKGYCISR